MLVKIVWDLDKGYWKWSTGILVPSVLIPADVIMLVTPIPTPWSNINESNVSLVRLFLTSFIVVSPIVLERH